MNLQIKKPPATFVNEVRTLTDGVRGKFMQEQKDIACVKRTQSVVYIYEQ